VGNAHTPAGRKYAGTANRYDNGEIILVSSLLNAGISFAYVFV
jgi:hypothetical protein